MLETATTNFGKHHTAWKIVGNLARYRCHTRLETAFHNAWRNLTVINGKTVFRKRNRISPSTFKVPSKHIADNTIFYYFHFSLEMIKALNFTSILWLAEDLLGILSLIFSKTNKNKRTNMVLKRSPELLGKKLEVQNPHDFTTKCTGHPWALVPWQLQGFN